jgi:hypothetical protein
VSYRIFLLAGAVLAGCQTAETVAPTRIAPSDGRPPLTTPAQSLDRAMGEQHEMAPPSHDPLPNDQLARVRAATARYQDLANALADGYVDIDVVIPNMGRHYLKPALLDAKFEIERPELLVYSPGDQGRMKLVAVEYAVPLDQSATAPEGFRGGADRWFNDQTFQLWTLHAWVWKDNPDGVFQMFNRRVP